MNSKPTPIDKIKKAIEDAKKAKKSAFNPVLRERDMAIQAQEDGSHGADMLTPKDNSHG